MLVLRHQRSGVNLLLKKFIVFLELLGKTLHECQVNEAVINVKYRAFEKPFLTCLLFLYYNDKFIQKTKNLKMKKILYAAVFATVCVCTFCLTSCTENLPDTERVQTSRNRVEWAMEVEMSRSVVNADGSGHFENGDTIVMSVRNLTDGGVKHYTLHLADGQWLPEIYWDELGDNVEFTAWHVISARRLHQTSQVSSDYLHMLSVNQEGEGYHRSDLLWAQAHVQAGGKVQLYFSHALHRLRLVLESKDASYTETQLQQAEVQVYTPCQLPFSLVDGVLHTPSDYQWITPSREADYSRMALLCPQETEVLRADGWIRIRINGQETTLKVPEVVDGKSFERLEAGKETIYRLNLQKGNAPDVFAKTTRWVYGVQESADGQWNVDHTQLSWTDGCGWFDCNKVNPSDVSSGGDGLMCWAAATSNLIHWWLQQNSETEAVKAYQGPKAVPDDMLHSEIFQLYKNHFPNQGDYPLKAINWFFNGVFYRKLYDTDQPDPAAGFFRVQLGSHSLGAEYVGMDLMRDRFNALVKQALSSQQGILFVVNLGKAWSTHAVTLWGVKFDENGLIDTLYMVDNNDGRYDKRGTIREMKVQYLPYSGTNQDLYPYVPNSLGNFTIRIESFCTLSLGREWIK